MKKMIRKIGIGIALASFLVLPVTTVQSQTLTDTIAGLTKWYGEDQSTYANYGSRMGLIVRHYRFDTDGGAASATNLGAALPDGAMIIGGFVHVTTALTASGVDQLGHTGDPDAFLASGGTLESTGIKDIIPAWATPASTGDLIDDAVTYVTLTPDTANAAGNFSVYLYYILTNP